MSEREQVLPDDLVPESESVLEVQEYDISDDQAAELAAYADQVEPAFRAGQLRSASTFFAEWERKRRIAS